MRPLGMLALVLLLAAALPAQRNLFDNPNIDGVKGWRDSGGGAGMSFALDRKVGKAARGSLHIANESASETTPFNWRQVVSVEKAKTRRFRLAAQLRTAGLEPGASANLVAQCWDEKNEQIQFVHGQAVSTDSDWRKIEVVFEATVEMKSLFVMAYLRGHGEVWWDDFELVETTDPVTPVARAAPPKDDASQGWARKVAGDLPWVFGADAAVTRAQAESKPVLVYVRCTDDRDGIGSARRGIEAETINFQDDGYKKDLLFRAGPLSDPDVAALVSRRFVPTCATYLLSSEGRGKTEKDWTPWGLRDAKAEHDRETGRTDPGALAIRVPSGNTWGYWMQILNGPAAGRKYRFSTWVHTEDLARGAYPEVDITANLRSAKRRALASSKKISGAGDWKRLEVELDVPAGAYNLIVRVKLVGLGKAFFDDLELVAGDSDENLLRDPGATDPEKGDPLAVWGASSADIVTPALLAIGKDGKVVRKLHRIGALSADLVDRWLRGVAHETELELGVESKSSSAAEAYADGDLDRALELIGDDRSPEAKELRARIALRRDDLKGAITQARRLRGPRAALLRGRIALREGDWKLAAKELQKAAEDESDARVEATYLLGACLQRQGDLDEARKLWLSIRTAAEPFGYKAALATQPAGPRPWLAETYRSWPEQDARTSVTETIAPGDFDGRESVQRLLELQKPDGSFTGHNGIVGYWDGAMTAVAVDALDRWLTKLSASERRRAERSIDSALDWLANWGKTRALGTDPFNAPYVLRTLVRHQRKDGAKLVIKKMLEGQLDDGNWSVYGKHRPASFNTAQCLIALVEAEKSGIEVPEKNIREARLALAAMRKKGDLFPYSTATGHDWMTTKHGAIGRDPLCEFALATAGHGKRKTLENSLERFLEHHEELRLPTKKLYDYFNSRGHGGYFFFFAHRNALEAARHARAGLRRKVAEESRKAVLAAREGDGTFMDHYMNGRAYATAMALWILAETSGS